MHERKASSAPLPESTANWALFVLFTASIVAGGLLLFGIVLATQ
jgi:hypothetical protein